MTYHIEQIGSVYYLVSQDGKDRLEAGHSRAVAEFAMATLNSGVTEREPDSGLNRFPAGRWNKPN